MGAPILEWVYKNNPDIYMDCHMMVSDPAKVRSPDPASHARPHAQWIPEVAKAGGKSYTFHYEASRQSTSPPSLSASTDGQRITRRFLT